MKDKNHMTTSIDEEKTFVKNLTSVHDKNFRQIGYRKYNKGIYDMHTKLIFVLKGKNLKAFLLRSE